MFLAREARITLLHHTLERENILRENVRQVYQGLGPEHNAFDLILTPPLFIS